MKRNIHLSKRTLIAVVAAETVSAALAWRDLAHRPDRDVRGPKKAWRVFIAINPGNSLLYWAVGRR